MAKLAVITIILTALAVGSSTMTPVEFGMDMGVQAYDAICWYENLKQFPKTDTNQYQQCSISASFQNDYIKKTMSDDSQRKEYYGKWIQEKSMSHLPSKYGSQCSKYLKNADASPISDESDALNDAGNEYPFKAFAYCLLSTLREIHGNDAISAVKSERTKARKYWKSTLLDRDNEWRARHGVSPMVRIADLDSAAQKWADKLATECIPYHSKNEDPERQWNGAGTGETLSGSGGPDIPEIAAYIASDGWYEENKDYPFASGGFKGNDDALFKKIGHFTQTVWEGTKYVGYGYAYNKDCPSVKAFLVGRYSPPGNFNNMYTENVHPPQD